MDATRSTAPMRSKRLPWLALFIACLWLLVLRSAHAQDFEFHPPPDAGDNATPSTMRDLAERVLPVYQEDDRERYLANLSILQLTAQNYLAADQTRDELRERRKAADAGRTPGRSVMIDLYTRAKVARQNDHVPFQQAFARVYRDTVPKLNNFDAYALTTLMAASPATFRAALQKEFEQHRAKGSVTMSEAVQLLTTYRNFEVQRSVAPLVAQLRSEDDKNRYTEDEPVFVAIPHGPSLKVLVVRPRNGPATLPALLEFTNDPAINYARECAAHGYIGVVAYARGVGGSLGARLPFQKDGADAREVIAWIIRQSWSDGRVGMYGSGYSGFAAWAAAKHLPPALKAIATADPLAPGINFPMEGSVYRNAALRWAYEQTIAPDLQGQPPPDDAAWRETFEGWYRRGDAYRDLRAPGRRRVPIFTRWLNHPSYDRFWQKMLPFQNEFAQISIPVLTMSGYYAASAPGATWYFSQHTRYNKQADHRLFIGPYDDNAIRRPTPAALSGLELDPKAQLNLRELRYQWFDAIFRGGRMPPLLQARINYEVPGANEWRHAADVEAISTGVQRYFLGAQNQLVAEGPAGAAPAAAPARPAARGSGIAAEQHLSFTDRSDASWTAAPDLVLHGLPVHNGVSFVSEPLARGLDLAGFVSGHLVVTVNRMDADFSVAAFELTAGGDYIKLFAPEFEFRASYLKDRIHRNLLGDGVRETLDFRSERMASRRLQAGSRIVLVLSIIKRPDREINYGRGDDVSVESMNNEGVEPLRVRWYSQSSIDFPVRDIPVPLNAPPKRQNSSQ